MTSHALTIDVGEWFRATALEPGATRRPEQILESRVIGSTLTLFDILREAKTRATFFAPFGSGLDIGHPD